MALIAFHVWIVIIGRRTKCKYLIKQYYIGIYVLYDYICVSFILYKVGTPSFITPCICQSFVLMLAYKKAFTGLNKTSCDWTVLSLGAQTNVSFIDKTRNWNIKPIRKSRVGTKNAMISIIGLKPNFFKSNCN